MNGSKAKALRKEIYGDHSQRARTYQAGGMMGPLGMLWADVFAKRLSSKTPLGTVRCAGKRAEYRAKKRQTRQVNA